MYLKKLFKQVRHSFTSQLGMLVLKKADPAFAIKTGLAAGISLFVGMYFSSFVNEGHPDNLVSGLWSAVSAVMVSQIHLGSSFRAAWVRFLGTAIGAGMSGIFITFLGVNPFSLGTSIATTIIICNVANLRANLSLTCTTVAVVMVLWDLNPAISPWKFAFFRLLNSCIGISVAIGIAYLIWPQRALKKMQHTVSETFASLAQLYLIVTLDEIQGKEVSTVSSPLVKTIEELLLRNHVFLEDAKLELLLTPQTLDQWDRLHHHLYRTYDLILSMQSIEKQPIKELVDSALFQHLQKFIDKTHAYFVALSAILQQDSSVDLPDISIELALLENDLKRFKNIHFIKENPSVIEGHFFIFFYTLKLIEEELCKSAAIVSALLIYRR